MRASDNKETRKTVGNYVLGQNAAGNGIRNYPYSYDKEISPYTYADGDPQQAPHGDGNGFYSYYTFGEIWVGVLHDLTLNMMETGGFSADLLNGDAGNNRALKLITLGMGLTTDNPAMTASRNAIVAANDMLYGGAYGREIWNAFARRGVGVFAIPGVPDPDDPAENPPIPFTLREDFTEPEFPNLPPPPPPVGGDGSDDIFYEPNETAARAFDLGSLSGTETVADLAIQQRPNFSVQDRDWFKFKTTSPGIMSITVDVPSHAGDLDVLLYRSLNGSPNSLRRVGLGQGQTRGAGRSETINVAVGAGQTYYVNIIGFNKAHGTYNLILDTP